MRKPHDRIQDLQGLMWMVTSSQSTLLCHVGSTYQIRWNFSNHPPTSTYVWNLPPYWNGSYNTHVNVHETVNELIRLIRVIDCGSFHLPHAHRGVGSLRSVSSETHVSPRQPDWRHRHKTWTWSIHYDRPVSKTCQTIAWQVKGERLVNLWTRLYKRQRGDRGTVCEHYWLYVDLAS
jgi:hypothetical protein